MTKAIVGVLPSRLAVVQSNLGENLWLQGDLSGALAACSRALALNPELADAHANLGHVLSAGGDLAGALECYHRAIALTPELAEAHANLGGSVWSQGDLAGALEACRRALARSPELLQAHNSLDRLLSHPGDRAAALLCYLRTATLPPESLRFLYYAALAHLLLGEFAAGWRYYEYRWHTKNYCAPQRNFAPPRWRGEPLNGARIFLHAEQGFGDTLQFVRYVPLVAARGGEVVLEVQPELQRLLAGMEGATQVISYGDALSDFAWHCPLLSLPFAFETELASIPAHVPYLRANAVAAQKWRLRLADNSRVGDEKMRVGLVWAGSPKHVRDHERSISLPQFAPLAQVDARFYSLQKGRASELSLHIPAGMQLVDSAPELKDFADTAALLSNVDLLITVDTAVAHLGGALGKPVWVLLTYAPDWRWMLQREDSPWYPTMRLFRQPTPGDWESVIDQVATELALLASRHVVTHKEIA